MILLLEDWLKKKKNKSFLGLLFFFFARVREKPKKKGCMKVAMTMQLGESPWFINFFGLHGGIGKLN